MASLLEIHNHSLGMFCRQQLAEEKIVNCLLAFSAGFEDDFQSYLFHFHNDSLLVCTSDVLISNIMMPYGPY